MSPKKKNKSGLDVDEVEAPELDLTIDDLASQEGTPTNVPLPKQAPPAIEPKATAVPRPGGQVKNSPPLRLEGQEVPVARSEPSEWNNTRVHTSVHLSKELHRERKGSFSVFIIVVLLLAGFAYVGHKLFLSGRKFIGSPTAMQDIFNPQDQWDHRERKTNFNPTTIAGREDQLPVSQGLFSASKAEATPGKVVVKTKILGYEVTVNGQPVKGVDNQFVIPAGKSELVIKRLGYDDSHFSLDLAAGETKVVEPTFAQTQARGFLSYETVPTATLVLQREGHPPIELDTPVEGKALPVGTYKATLRNGLINYRSEEIIEIKEWKSTNLRRTLQSK